ELGNPAVVGAIGYGRHLKPAMLAVTGQTFLDDDAAGYVLDSLSLAVAALLDPRPFAEVLVDIVRVGNDTDSNGAIAGGLLRTPEGAGAVPEAWVSVLQFADEFLAAAEVFAAG